MNEASGEDLKTENHMIVKMENHLQNDPSEVEKKISSYYNYIYIYIHTFLPENKIIQQI